VAAALRFAKENQAGFGSKVALNEAVAASSSVR
jgi:hypothetical protein